MARGQRYTPADPAAWQEIQSRLPKEPFNPRSFEAALKQGLDRSDWIERHNKVLEDLEEKLKLYLQLFQYANEPITADERARMARYLSVWMEFIEDRITRTPKVPAPLRLPLTPDE